MNPLFIKLMDDATTTITDVTTTSAESVTSTVAEAAEKTKITWSDVWNLIVQWCTSTGIKIVIALIVLIVSFKLINFFSKRITKKLAKRKADATLSKVLVNTGRILLKVLVVICLVGYLGIETTSVSAVLLALGTGISLALQGTLSNFAGGVIIIIMRPFVLGDFITSNGESGTVEDIKLFYTYITTVDNRVVMIPNGTLANNVIVNASAKDTRRCDVTMSIAYDADAERAKNIIKDVCRANEKIFDDPAPFAEVGEYAASSVDIFVRVWCKASDYWDVKWYMLKEIKAEFDKAGIEIPFDQLDVNIKKN